MARPKKNRDPESGEGGGITGEYKRPDAARALKIFEDEIAPKQAHMQTIKGDLSDPYKRIKDDCHFPRTVLEFAIKLADMEQAKKDHFLLALNLIFAELDLTMPRDLVTLASGEADKPIVPEAKAKEPAPAARPRPTLVSAPPVKDHPADDSDLAGGFTEATAEELAQQEGRKPAPEPEAGTGAAAIKAMKAKS